MEFEKAKTYFEKYFKDLIYGHRNVANANMIGLGGVS